MSGLTRDRSRMAGSHKLPDAEAYCCMVHVRLRPGQMRALEAFAKRKGVKAAPLARDAIGMVLQMHGADEGQWSNHEDA